MTKTEIFIFVCLMCIVVLFVSLHCIVRSYQVEIYELEIELIALEDKIKQISSARFSD